MIYKLTGNTAVNGRLKPQEVFYYKRLINFIGSAMGRVPVVENHCSTSSLSGVFSKRPKSLGPKFLSSLWPRQYKPGERQHLRLHRDLNRFP